MSAPATSPRLEDFLAYILPEQGVYIAAYKKPDEKWMGQVTAPSIVVLADTIRERAAHGEDTYFACAAYNGVPNTRVDTQGKSHIEYRTVPQIVGIRSLWLDIDVGDNKGYATLADAWAAFSGWLQRYGLPMPTLVNSGYGMHCYWRLDRTLSYEEWHGLAGRLKQLTFDGGLETDTTRTADGASILRPPETWNFKRGGQAPVVCGPLEPPVSVEWLSQVLPAAIPTRTVSRETLAANDPFTNIHEEIPSFAAEAAKSCNWLRFVGTELRGNVEEPLWYAMLGLLAYARDGAQMAQAWSIGHLGYDPTNTYNKMMQAMSRQTGPTTCSAFQDKWPAGCAGCPHRGAISTPLQLGRRTAQGARVQVATQRSDMPSLPAARLLPYGHSWGVNGALLISGHDDNGLPTLRQIYNYPLYVEALRTGEVSNIAYAFIRHFAPYDGWRGVNFPAGDLTAKESVRMLGNQHIEVMGPNARDFGTYLARAKSNYKDRRSTALQHETFGWKDNSFLIGHTLIMNGVHGKAGVSEELERYAEKLYCRGTLAAWSKAVQPLFRSGYEYQAVAVLASLAAPLMRFAPYPGTVYSVVHQESGKGKTLSAEVANSVWGADKVLWVSHRDEQITSGDTIKAQYRVMSLLKSLPVIIDEMREINPEKLRGWILAFTDGSPRKTLTKDGVLRGLSGGWQTIMQTTSNKSIVDIVTVNNDPAAASRVFEVNASLPPDADAVAGNAIRSGAMDNHGWAGLTFMEKLLEPATLSQAEQRVAELVEELTTELQAVRKNVGGGDRYIASFLAVMITAGELCNKFGLLTCDTKHLRLWALSQWGQQRAQIEYARHDTLENLGAFIREHWLSTLSIESEGKPNEGVVPLREPVKMPLVIRHDKKTGIMSVDRATVQKWCLPQNIHFQGFLQDLFDKGVIIDRNAKKNLGAGTLFKSGGQARVLVIDTMHPLMSGMLRSIEDAPPQMQDTEETVAKSR